MKTKHLHQTGQLPSGRRAPVRLFGQGASGLAGFFLALLWTFAGTLHAARAPLPPDKLVGEADLVLTGQILDHKIGTERSHFASGFGSYDWAIDVTLRIQSVGKGNFDQSETIVVRAFRSKSRKSFSESMCAGGNYPIPEVGAEVRAHLHRQGEGWRVIFPNGFAPLTDQKPLTDAAAVRALGGLSYTYGLPVEGWICLAVLGMVFFLIRRLIRRFRRHRRKHVQSSGV